MSTDHPSEPLRAAIVGLGQTAEHLINGCRERDDIQIVAAISTSPSKIGRDCGAVLGGVQMGVVVSGDLDAALADDRVDVVLHTGQGTPTETAELLGRCLDAGVDVITVNGFAHPGATVGAARAEDLAARARRGGARLLGTGVNPGFLLDSLPVVIGSLLPRVELVEVRRVSDAASWSPTLLRQLGIGQSLDSPAPDLEYPLLEQLMILVDGLGLYMDEHDEISELLGARSARVAGGIEVSEGSVVGFRRVARASHGGVTVAQVEWLLLVAIDASVDGVVASASATLRGGDQVVQIDVTGTLLTDPYTAAAMRMANAARPLRSMPPGVYRPDQVPASIHP